MEQVLKDKGFEQFSYALKENQEEMISILKELGITPDYGVSDENRIAQCILCYPNGAFNIVVDLKREIKYAIMIAYNARHKTKYDVVYKGDNKENFMLMLRIIKEHIPNGVR